MQFKSIETTQTRRHEENKPALSKRRDPWKPQFDFFSVSPCLRGCILFLTILSCVSSAAQPAEIQELMKIQEQALADAKDLAASSLPDPKSWGEDWRKPWEIPAGFPAHVANEAAYWDKIIKNMGAAGLSPSDAQKVLSIYTSGFAQEGMSARDATVQALTSLRQSDAPAAQKILDQWEISATTLRLAASAGRDQEAFRKILMQALSEPYKSLSDEQLTQAYLREATLIRKRTLMSFYKCNNFAALANVRSDQEIKDAGLWIGTVDVNLMFADESRTSEIADLPAAECSKLEGRLQAAVGACVSGMTPMLKQQLDKELARAQENAQANPNDPEPRKRAQAAQEKYDAAIAAARQTKAQVTMKEFGDNSYVIRIIGVNPDVAGEKAGLFIGWIRKGQVMCEISVKGNAPEAELSKAMDHFLSEMDAKLASYDSTLGGMMAIAPAGALPTPVADSTTVSAPKKEKKKTPVIPKKPKVAVPVDTIPTDTGITGIGTPADATTGNVTRPGDPPPPIHTGATIDPPEYAQAITAWNRGDQLEAHRLVDAALAKSPDHVNLLMMRGSIHNFENNLSGALADYKRAAELDPNSLPARRYHALFELVAGDAKIAATEADAAIKLSNGDIETHLLRGRRRWRWINPTKPARTSQKCYS